MRRALITAAAVGMFATACTSGGDSSDADATSTTGPDGATSTTSEVVTLDPDELRFVSSLRTFDECESLLDHIHTEAAERVGPFGLQGDGWYGPIFFEEGDVVAADDAAESTVAVEEAPADFDRADAGAEGGADGANGLVEGEDFSGTNVQELGVDEADLVKTDGERILVLAGNQLIVVDPATGTETDRLQVAEGWNPEMFLAGDEVLLISRGDIQIGPTPSSGDAEEGFVEDSIEPYYGGSATIVQRISLAGTPSVLETLRVEGDYITARSVDGIAQVVMRHDPQWQLPFVYPQSQAGEDRAAEANREIVRETDLDDWLPNYTVEVGGEVVDEGLLAGCADVHAPTEFSGFGSSTVLTVPISGDIDPGAASTVLAPGEIVYASPGAVYVATTNWLDATIAENEQDWQEAWENRRTNVHRFDTSGERPAYTASGSVVGTIRDQFSLSEFDEHLRVVTTTGDPWGETSSSQVRVLRESDGELVEVGSVGDIGNGEDVQSVRFVGDTAYVVTFRQIDPFYTVDLSDPENPQVLGELKIPGFSSYLHPIGEGRVLGVGSDADEEGRITGAKVSLFDVTDLSNPQEVAVWTAPDGWNDVGWEHRSFLWWEPEQIAVIPVQLWAENWAGAVVLQVQGGELVEVGRIDHVDEGGPEPGTTECDVLTAADLGFEEGQQDFDSELGYIVTEGYGLVLLCGDGEPQTAVGHDCYAEPYFADEAARIGFEIPEGEQLVTCWPNAQLQTIVRSLVIGDDLWTLSGPWGDLSQGGRLQSNAIVGLERGAVVDLS